MGPNANLFKGGSVSPLAFDSASEPGSQHEKTKSSEKRRNPRPDRKPIDFPIRVAARGTKRDSAPEPGLQHEKNKICRKTQKPDTRSKTYRFSNKNRGRGNQTRISSQVALFYFLHSLLPPSRGHTTKKHNLQKNVETRYPVENLLIFQ